MKVAGAHAVAALPDLVYTLLTDPATLAKCIPGCEGLEHLGNGDYKMKMKLGIGSVSGRFDGKVQLADQKPPESYRMIVEGSSKVGFMKGDGVLSFSTAEGASSNVAFEGEVHVGGAIANVGQRLIETTAKLIIKRFFDNVSKEVAQASGTVA